MQFWADDGQKNHLKHVERPTEINKLWNVSSCWLYSANVLTMCGPMNVKFPHISSSAQLMMSVQGRTHHSLSRRSALPVSTALIHLTHQTVCLSTVASPYTLGKNSGHTLPFLESNVVLFEWNSSSCKEWHRMFMDCTDIVILSIKNVTIYKTGKSFWLPLILCSIECPQVLLQTITLWVILLYSLWQKYVI